jgi:hypothetical protein
MACPRCSARWLLEQTPYRIAKPIVRKDSEGNMYDLTRHFVEQQMLYPFAPLKDLVDAPLGSTTWTRGRP